jgi:hypothetical protein
VLRAPAGRITSTLGKFESATSVVDEWDRRLQTLGVPLSPENG